MYTYMSNIRLHTPQELEDIAKTDFERFKQISKYYYENDFPFFEEFIIPIIERHKNSTSFESQYLDKPEVTNESITEVLLISNVKPKTPWNKKLILYALTSLILISTALVLYYTLIYRNSYRQGIGYLKDKNYPAALEKFAEIDSTSDSFPKIQDALNFAKGCKSFDEQDYRSAATYLRKVNNSSEFYEESKTLLDKIVNDPNIIYYKAINHINQKEYDEAMNELQRVKPSDIHYNQSQSKIMYVRGVIEYNLGNYENANTYFGQVEKTDEFYQDIIAKQPAIDNYINTQRDKESDISYARTLIQIADDFEDEHQLFENVDTFIYTKNTYLPRLIQLRSQLNSSYYGANKKNSSLTDFKTLILKWMNSYIDYAESLNTYGYYSNYNANSMWYNYGNTLRSKRGLGKELHQKVIKNYKEIQSQFGLN